ncbi:hypothetical protein GCM10025857_03930 [Alicyclobacillus contaminans]|uniref:magnesium transporter MgtE N-terminal domain-containing protein n=1 Tax=Alicyclobacillus contaminans TaxID=392016 RepID=UPI00040BDBD6|nr:hypothetical protein [Alicyclobacillus contaminans]GMA49036.1 hypothetical protein GCM10025857_03930 [Alicyclobacillus contaminans]
MKAEAASAEQAQRSMPRWLQKLVWALLVVVVPIIAAVIMIGVALQIVGVPVWQTTRAYFGGGSHTASAPATTLQTQYDSVQAQNRALRTQLSQLQQQVTTLQQQNQALSAQVQQWRGAAAAKQDALQTAKKEAAILQGMDPTAGAALLAKMSVQEAAAAVAQMSADASGQLLAQLDAAKAAQILSQAAQIQQQTSTTNSTNNSTNG